MRRGHLLALTQREQRQDQAWFRITNSTDSSSARIDVFDEIGWWGVTAQEFAQQIALVDADTIELHLNSPGGEIFDGVAIKNALEQHPATVNVTVDGIAASIASVIAMAGDTISMAPGSQMMIHEGAGMCFGNAADMQDMAALLDKQSDNIAAIYAERAGGTQAEWRERMRAETWYLAEEAVEAGLADKVLPARGGKAQALHRDLSVFNFRYAGREQAPDPLPKLQAACGPVPTDNIPALVEEPTAVEDAQAPAVVDTPAPTDQDTTPLGDAPTAAAADPWTDLTAHLTHAASQGDALARLREALR